MIRLIALDLDGTLLDPAGHPFCLDNGQPEAPQHG